MLCLLLCLFQQTLCIRVRLLKRLKMYRMNAKLLRRLTVVLSVINKQTARCGQLILLQAGLINRRMMLYNFS